MAPQDGSGEDLVLQRHNQLQDHKMIMKRPVKISVVIATYNQVNFLSEALKSIFEQDLPRELYEVIVVDDGSTDSTQALLRPYRKELVILQQPHGGLSKACNLGLSHAQGEYWTRLDSDDLVGPTWLSQTLQMLDQHPEACCVYPDTVELFEDGTRADRPIEEGNLYALVACGTLFRTEAIRAVGGFRSLYWEEYDLYLRLRSQGAFLHLKTPLYFYRQHPSSMTADLAKRREGWRELVRTWGPPLLQAQGNSSELEEVIRTG